MKASTDTQGITDWLRKPVPNQWLSALRVLLGLLMSWSAARYLLYGWVDRFYVKPEYFFHYTGFSWLPVPGEEALYGIFGLLVALGLMVSVGLMFRVACVLWTTLFTWMWLLDVTNYLNHYYLLSVLALLLSLSPAGQSASLDVRLGLVNAVETVPRYVKLLFGGQAALVYFYAGMAKLQPDWLLHGQPLNIWLLARTDTPVVGPLFEYWQTALFMSWAGFLFDSTIWALLLWRRTRTMAFVVVVVFHAATAQLFDIGIFPLIMPIAATALFSPRWPATLVRGLHRVGGGGVVGRTGAPGEQRCTPSPAAGTCSTGDRLRCWPGRLAPALVLFWLVAQAVIPARVVATRGDVLWGERGMRWSWRVMVRTKGGDVSYRVVRTDEEGETTRIVTPARYLSAHQEREMSGQPDLIVQLGRHIGEQSLVDGATDVAVYAVSFASLNGRSMQRLVREDVDLMQVSTLWDPIDTWVTPPPEEPPPHFGRGR